MRKNPALDIEDRVLSASDQKKSIAMMRINHAGEICAQALYHGQAIVCKSPKQTELLLNAAEEEVDHLNWCKQRLEELEASPSKLAPIWYLGSLGIGMIAGLAGDKISLGFLAETEHQVTKHIQKHLDKISPNDKKSRAILEQMKIDEMQHATTAEENGGVALPKPIKKIMNFTSKILTFAAAKI